MTEHISMTERRELRSVIRQQFKLLHVEIEQRRVELHAEAERRLAGKYHAADEARQQFFEAKERLSRRYHDELRSELQDICLRLGIDSLSIEDGYGGSQLADTSQKARQQDAREMEAAVSAQVKTAALALSRQEADLLRNLAASFIETEQAQTWLAAIPVVAELVPSSRLDEIPALQAGAA